VIVFQVLDPRELAFDFHNAMLFQDVESQRDVYIDPEAVRSDYQQRFAAHTGVVETTCRRLGISFQRALTNRPMELGLFDFLRARSSHGKQVRRKQQTAGGGAK
jgi:hypothetical protein